MNNNIIHIHYKKYIDRYIIHMYSINSYIQKQLSNEDDFMNTGRNLASEMGNVLVMSISGFYSVVGMAFGIGLSLARSLPLSLPLSLSLSLSLSPHTLAAEGLRHLQLKASHTSSLRPHTLFPTVPHSARPLLLLRNICMYMYIHTHTHTHITKTDICPLPSPQEWKT